jgi:hypothetical protein
MKLNPKQKKFCELYVLNGYNATQAYKEAGYSCKNDQIASEKASRLLASNGKVKLYIAKLENEQSKEFKIEKDDILQELMKMAFGNIGDIVDIKHGNFVLKDGVDPKKQRQFLASVSNLSGSVSYGKAGESKSFSIASKDKIKALELIARMTGVLDGATDNGDSKPAVSKVLEVIRKLGK